MPLKLNQTQGALSAFRRMARGLGNQATFHIPTNNPLPFVDAITSALDPFRSGRATIIEVVFEPRMLNAFLAARSIPPLDRRDTRAMNDWSLESDEPETIRELLGALFADSIEFAFVPAPKPFVIYADHDAYATFFASTKSNLNRVVRQMSARGIQPVEYLREL